MRFFRKIYALFFCICVLFCPLHAISSGSSEMLTLQSGWKNYSDGHSDFQPAMVKRDGLLCTVQGVIIASGKNNLIAILPTGYRPLSRLAFMVSSNTSSVRVDVTPAGEILFVEGELTDGFLSLSGITFSNGAFGLGELLFKKFVCLLNQGAVTSTNYAKSQNYKNLVFGTLPYIGPSDMFGYPTFFKSGYLRVIQGMVQEGAITVSGYSLRLSFDLLARGSHKMLRDIYPIKIDQDGPGNVPVKFFQLTTSGTIDRTIGGEDGLNQIFNLAYLNSTDESPKARHVFCEAAHAFMNRVDVLANGNLYWVAGPRTDSYGKALEYLSLSGIIYSVLDGISLDFVPGVSQNYEHGYAPGTCGKEGDFCWIQGVLKLDNKKLKPASKDNENRGTLIAKLPSSVMPPLKRLVFLANAHGDTNRVDVFPDGKIYWVSGRRQVDWLSLSGIIY